MAFDHRHTGPEEDIKSRGAAYKMKEYTVMNGVSHFFLPFFYLFPYEIALPSKRLVRISLKAFFKNFARDGIAIHNRLCDS